MRLIAAILVLASVAASAAEAASLQVSPVTIQLNAPASAAQLTLTNRAGDPLQIQVRAFRWTQVDGEDQLERTADVVASPPATLLEGESEGLVRVIRVAKTPVAQEESYRVLIDQLPDPTERTGVTLKILMRYSIPVFVVPADQAPPQISWSAQRGGNALTLTATNSGGQRLKVTSLVLAGDGATSRIKEEGLVGYVLAGGTKSWSYTVSDSGFRPGTTLHISGTGEHGTFNATTQIRAE